MYVKIQYYFSICRTLQCQLTCFLLQVTWLASWTENVQGQVKYIMLNPSSKLKGEKDWQKYETARKLAKSIDKIREDYIADWKSKEMKIRQRAVAMYFIDKVGGWSYNRFVHWLQKYIFTIQFIVKEQKY